MGGILFDAVTFRWAIMFIVGLEAVAFILLALFLIKAITDITQNSEFIPSKFVNLDSNAKPNQFLA